MLICWACKSVKELVYTDEVERGYCAECVTHLPTPSTIAAQDFLNLTIPFRVGDRVVCRTGGQVVDGTGRVEEVYFDLTHGASPVYPTFQVRMEEKTYPELPDVVLYTEVCLTLKSLAEVSG